MSALTRMLATFQDFRTSIALFALSWTTCESLPSGNTLAHKIITACQVGNVSVWYWIYWPDCAIILSFIHVENTNSQMIIQIHIHFREKMWSILWYNRTIWRKIFFSHCWMVFMVIKHMKVIRLFRCDECAETYQLAVVYLLSNHFQSSLHNRVPLSQDYN